MFGFVAVFVVDVVDFVFYFFVFFSKTYNPTNALMVVTSHLVGMAWMERLPIHLKFEN